MVYAFIHCQLNQHETYPYNAQCTITRMDTYEGLAVVHRRDASVHDSDTPMHERRPWEGAVSSTTGRPRYTPVPALNQYQHEAAPSQTHPPAVFYMNISLTVPLSRCVWHPLPCRPKSIPTIPFPGNCTSPPPP